MTATMSGATALAADFAAAPASGAFSTDANWLSFHPQPGKPRFVVPPGSIDAHCTAHRPDGLAYRHLLRGGGPAGSVSVLCLVADTRGDRSHGKARRRKIRRWSRVCPVHAVDAGKRQLLVQGLLSRAAERVR